MVTLGFRLDRRRNKAAEIVPEQSGEGDRRVVVQ
jgi:hypothetical protein